MHILVYESRCNAQFILKATCVACFSFCDFASIVVTTTTKVINCTSVFVSSVVISQQRGTCFYLILFCSEHLKVWDCVILSCLMYHICPAFLFNHLRGSKCMIHIHILWCSVVYCDHNMIHRKHFLCSVWMCELKKVQVTRDINYYKKLCMILCNI